MTGSKAKAENGKLRRRTVLRNSAITVGGLAAASGTASAGKSKGKQKHGKKKSAVAGWVLAKKDTCEKLKSKKPKYFKVLYKTGFENLPAGCSENSAEKKYVCYVVEFKTKKGEKYEARIYRRKNQKQLKEGAYYNVKHVKSCGKNCRVHFKRKKDKK